VLERLPTPRRLRPTHLPLLRPQRRPLLSRKNSLAKTKPVTVL